MRSEGSGVKGEAMWWEGVRVEVRRDEGQGGGVNEKKKRNKNKKL